LNHLQTKRIYAMRMRGDRRLQ